MLLICGLFVVGSDRAEAEEALASWYGPGFDGKTMANGENFDADGLSTAHPTLPIGTELIVSYGGKSVPVTVTDRGPYTGNRELDLSQGAAEDLGLIRPGVDYVEVTCANGGIYPNCTPDSTSPQPPYYSTTPQDGLVVEEVPPDPATQYENTVQDGTAIQGETALQDGGTTIPDGSAVQDGTAAQDGSAVQDGTTVQDGTGGGVHVVQPGETLAGIAAQLGTSADHLIMHNGITDPNVIYAGQALLY